MNFKTTLVLLVLLLLVGGYVMYDRLSRGPGGAGLASSSGGASSQTDPTAAGGKLLSGFVEGEATTLDIEPAGEPKISLKRQPGGTDPAGEGRWELTAPLTAKADAAAVMSVLTQITTATSRGTPGQSAQTGFAPAVTVRMTRSSGGAVTLAVGPANAVGEAVARLDQTGTGPTSTTTWHLVPGDLAESLTRTPAALRDRQLVHARQADIRTLTLEHSGKWLRLLRGPEGWTLAHGTGTPPAITPNTPGPLRADDAAVTDLLISLTSLMASDFPRTATNPLTPTQLTVRYTVAAPAAPSTQPATPDATATSASEQLLRFGRFEDARRERVLVRSGGDDAHVALVTASSLTSLRKSALDLRDRRVLDLAPADVTRVEIVNTTDATTRPAEAIILTREPELTPAPTAAPATAPATAPAPAAPTTATVAAASTAAAQPAATSWSVNGAPADPEKVSALLDQLRPLRATKYLEGPAATQPTTPWRLTLITASGSTELFVGENAARLGDLTFEPASDLLASLRASFAAPAKPIPFVEAGDASTQPATPPTTQPATPTTTQPAP